MHLVLVRMCACECVPDGNAGEACFAIARRTVPRASLCRVPVAATSNAAPTSLASLSSGRTARTAAMRSVPHLHATTIATTRRRATTTRHRAMTMHAVTIAGRRKCLGVQTHPELAFLHLRYSLALVALAFVAHAKHGDCWPAWGHLPRAHRMPERERERDYYDERPRYEERPRYAEPPPRYDERPRYDPRYDR